MLPQLSGRLLIDATELGTLNLDPADDGMTDEDLRYPDGKVWQRLNSVAKPLTDDIATPELMLKLPALSVVQEASVVAILFVVIGSVIIIPFLTVAACVLLSWPTLATLLLGSIVFMVGVDRLLPDQCWPPNRFPASIRLLLYKYFGYKLIFPPPSAFLNKDGSKRHFIMAGAPHGVIPLGDILGCLICPLGPINSLGAPAALNAPLWGKMLRLMGMVSCEKETALAFMAQGRSIGVIPGGIAEIFLTNDNTEGAYLKKRKGFCKLAIQAGRPLVPCYTFGNTQVLHCLTGAFLKRLSAMLRVSLTLFWGRWGLPVPFRVPILFTCGDPIEVDQNDNPTQAQVDELHEQFLGAMHELFEAHKSLYGWTGKQLVFE